MDSPQWASPRILIAEDEVTIALNLETQLQNAGFETVGPAYSAAQASELVASETVDAAVLNIALVRRVLHDVVWPLVASRTPIVFISGSDPDDLPEWMPPAEVCLKPCSLVDLVTAVRRALGAPLQ
jgi:DNA-binding response OmpR family regulator